MLHNLCRSKESVGRLETYLLAITSEPESQHAVFRLLNARNELKYTALHVAIFSRNIEAARILLKFGADPSAKCCGTPCLHLSIAIAALPDGKEFGLECFSALLDQLSVVSLQQVAGAPNPFFAKDDSGYTALHFACECNLPVAVESLLQSVRAVSEADALSLLSSSTRYSKETALHRAAWRDSVECAALLVKFGAYTGKERHILSAATGYDPLHCAAYAGAAKVWKLLIGHGGETKALSLRDKMGRTPVELLRACAWDIVEGDIRSIAPKLTSCNKSNNDDDNNNNNNTTTINNNSGSISGEYTKSSLDASKCFGFDTNMQQREQEGSVLSACTTAIVCHPLCGAHLTCPPSAVELSSAPPENAKRLEVLIDAQKGVLRGTEISRHCRFVERSNMAVMADILRVHEWSYVKHIHHQCERLEPAGSPRVVLQEDEEGEGGTETIVGMGYLDGDTTICKDSFKAAVAAAGAVCHAVDLVANATVGNAFCPVRPPGHHAGPMGAVKSPHGGSESHGFCLLNNISVGAAYAMNKYREKFKKVAIVDFDVHHGNGTEETIRWLKPSAQEATMVNAVCFGTVNTARYKPWCDVTDHENVLFVSVHGYGPRSRGLESIFPAAAFYPGSGATTFPTGLPVQPIEPAHPADKQEDRVNTKNGDNTNASSSSSSSIGVAFGVLGSGVRERERESSAIDVGGGSGSGVGAQMGDLTAGPAQHAMAMSFDANANAIAAAGAGAGALDGQLENNIDFAHVFAPAAPSPAPSPHLTPTAVATAATALSDPPPGRNCSSLESRDEQEEEQMGRERRDDEREEEGGSGAGSGAGSEREDSSDDESGTSQGDSNRANESAGRVSELKRMYGFSTLSSHDPSQRAPPLILDVGISLPADDADELYVSGGGAAGAKFISELSYRTKWRNYFRLEVFPRLAAFDPDVIFISAGFDAHRKDSINSGYIALVEEDFEWITGNLLAVANACCGGRVVSALEGGYMTGGECCSAFAKSVAAHVLALQRGARCPQTYSPEDSAREQEMEEQYLRDLEAQRNTEVLRRENMRKERFAMQETARRTAERTERPEQGASGWTQAETEAVDMGASRGVRSEGERKGEGEGDREGEKREGGSDPAAEATQASASATATATARKRKRPQVDYVSLDKELRAKHAPSS